MWHEARRQEKKIRCMLVDYQRRAQRRKDYYEKIKADPTQFLQLHGRPCKIHLDPAVVIAANGPAAMMPWQGNTDVMIDRFDVRAHLDIIPEVVEDDDNQMSYDERQINYERYRILVQNEFFGILEEKFLHQIYLEEKFGPVLKNADQEANKKKSACAAAIAYNYDTDINKDIVEEKDNKNVDSDEKEESDSEDDVDLDLTLDVTKIEVTQANELNTFAHSYGMQSNDFFSFLSTDLEEAESIRLAKALEEEKAMYSGRKSRKERRAYRERTLAGRVLSPPSYAWKENSSYESYKTLINQKSSRSRTRSRSPVNAGQITYITSFGDEDASATTSTNVGKSRASTSKKLSDLKKSIRKKSSSPSSGNFREKVYSNIKTTDSSKSSIRLRSRSRSKSYDRRHKRYGRSASRSSSKSRDRKYNKHNRRSRSRSVTRSDTKYKDRGGTPKQRKKSGSPPSTSQKTVKTSASSLELSKKEDMSGSSKDTSCMPTTIPRYYGRKKDANDSSELSVSSDNDSSSFILDSNSAVGSRISSQSSPLNLNHTLSEANSSSKSGSQIKTSSAGSRLTPQERLKRKRQVLLRKQFKADKRAEEEKMKKVVQERIERAEEMKEISIRLRRRQRMLRHNDDSYSYSSDSDTSYRRRSRSPPKRFRRENSRTRSRPCSSSSSDRRNRSRDRRRKSSSVDRDRHRRYSGVKNENERSNRDSGSNVSPNHRKSKASAVGSCDYRKSRAGPSSSSSSMREDNKASDKTAIDDAKYIRNHGTTVSDHDNDGDNYSSDDGGNDIEKYRRRKSGVDDERLYQRNYNRDRYETSVDEDVKRNKIGNPRSSIDNVESYASSPWIQNERSVEENSCYDGQQMTYSNNDEDFRCGRGRQLSVEQYRNYRYSDKYHSNRSEDTTDNFTDDRRVYIHDNNNASTTATQDRAAVTYRNDISPWINHTGSNIDCYSRHETEPSPSSSSSGYPPKHEKRTGVTYKKG